MNGVYGIVRVYNERDKGSQPRGPCEGPLARRQSNWDEALIACQLAQCLLSLRRLHVKHGYFQSIQACSHDHSSLLSNTGLIGGRRPLLLVYLLEMSNRTKACLISRPALLLPILHWLDLLLSSPYSRSYCQVLGDDQYWGAGSCKKSSQTGCVANHDKPLRYSHAMNESSTLRFGPQTNVPRIQNVFSRELSRQPVVTTVTC